MALEEHDREDLLREGRNMPWRGACKTSGVEVVVGFRKQGQVSLFCGVDPVFQFNSVGQLRRVFFNGQRYSADNGKLVSLSRTSRGGRVELVADPVDDSTWVAVRDSMLVWLDSIRLASDAGSWRVEGEPVDAFRQRLVRWLDQLPPEPAVADQPNV